MPELIAKHNAKFAVKPKEEASAYRSLSDDLDLTYVFTVREQRQIGPGQTISYDGKLYTLASNTAQSFEPRTVVEVRETPQGEVVIFHQGKAVAPRQTEKPIRQTVEQRTKKAGSAQPRKPAVDHPWKTPQDLIPKQVKHSKKRRDFQDAMYSQHKSYADGSW